MLGEGNRDLINLYTCIQQHGETFIAECKTYFTGQFNNADDYYRLREQFNTSHDPHLKSLLFMYLNHHGYNGLCRYNQSGIFNVPFGRYVHPHFPEEALRFFHNKSQQAEFIYADFRGTFAKAEYGDVIYCDPPYVPLTKTAHFSKYTPLPFTESDQLALAELAIESTHKGITVLISNHDTDFTRQHYNKASIQSFPVSRMISCKGKQRQPVNELLALFNQELL